MKRFSLVALCILMGFLAFGCGKKSGLEGKVVDGKGKPVANVKIIAKQVQPIKGYEQFEATTGSNGTFSFGKLFPTSEYILFPWYEDWTEAPMRTLRYKANNLVARFNKEGWTTEEKMKAQSGPEGETIILASPIVIQPCISGIEGKLVDAKGQPIGNIKVIAKQVKPVPGYESFETTTNSNGTFSFGKLFPTSEYVLLPWYKDWTEAPMRTLRYEANKLVARLNKEGWSTKQNLKVQSGPEGETIMLASAMVIQPCISGIEGKVVNGKNLPISNIKLVAKQIDPVPGYNQFETTTASDGSFRFAKLFPASKYTLLPSSEDWKSSVKWTVKTMGDQETLDLKPALMIRFINSKAGVITDSYTGLQWAPDPGRGMNWSQANRYAQRLKLGGYDDWRLPTTSELRGLYDPSLRTRYKIDPLFRLSHRYVWSSVSDSSTAVIFIFSDGDKYWSYHDNSLARAFAVRSRSDG